MVVAVVVFQFENQKYFFIFDFVEKSVKHKAHSDLKHNLQE